VNARNAGDPVSPISRLASYAGPHAHYAHGRGGATLRHVALGELRSRQGT
jgi:hypothetical protein